MPLLSHAAFIPSHFWTRPRTGAKNRDWKSKCLTVKPADCAQMLPSWPQMTACLTILVAINWSSTYDCHDISIICEEERVPKGPRNSKSPKGTLRWSGRRRWSEGGGGWVTLWLCPRRWWIDRRPFWYQYHSRRECRVARQLGPGYLVLNSFLRSQRIQVHKFKVGTSVSLII